MKESPQEKMYHEMLPDELRDKIQVSQSYQYYLGIINSLLFTIYGDRADWGKCLSAYFYSPEYRRTCHNGRRIGNIKTLSREEINKMLCEEVQYSANVDKLINLYHKFTKISSGMSGYECIYKMANILGLLPENSNQALYQWIIQRKGIAPQEQSNLDDRIAENLNLFGIIVSTLAKMFLPGFQLRFSSVGCVMTKSKSRYFYRGENAFYKSSTASVFRKDNNTPLQIKPIVDYLRLHECWSLLDQFNAVKNWPYSGINYLALAQHYGLRTQMIDITSNLKMALFFACCKFGDDRKWHPLQKTEIEHINSRKFIAQLGGDSRYGILYRTPSEITEMKWALEDKDAGLEIITPVGYQPFMRCSQQDAYMIIAKDKNYNLLNDPMFEIYRIPLNEDLCRWIYDEMDGGKAVFPHDDIPNIAEEIESINQQQVFSESVFQTFTRSLHLDAEAVRRLLSKYGFAIKGNARPISSERLVQINSQYSIKDAMDKIGIAPLSSPLLIISSDTLINEDGTIAIQK